MHPHWTSVTNIIIRFLSLIFTLIAFSLMAAANNGGQDQTLVSYNSFSALKYVIAVNVVACFYSIIQILIFLLELISHGWLSFPSPALYYFTYAYDQVLAYLLFSCSSSGATAIDVIARLDPGDLSGFYTNAAASVAMSFMAFFVFAASALITGYYLVRNT